MEVWKHFLCVFFLNKYCAYTIINKKFIENYLYKTSKIVLLKKIENIIVL